MRTRSVAILFVLAVVLLGAQTLAAHCDTLSGPVVADARKALAKGDVTPVLKWVRPADEAEVRSAFAQTRNVRVANDAARELADRWFFETVVRLHRASEGEPFTGLKSEPVAEPLAMADESITTGNVDALVQHATKANVELLRKRFADVRAARAHADESVAAGRHYVETYVAFMHLIEQLTGEGHAEHAD